MIIHIQIPISTNFLRLSKKTVIFLYFTIITLLYAIGKSPRPIKQELDDFEVADVYLVSAYFYYKSESLGDRSFALLLNSDLEFGEKNKYIQIMAKNGKQTKVVNASLEKISPHKKCSWVPYFSSAELGFAPTSLQIYLGEKYHHIPFKWARTTKTHDVATCISPLFANEQWQFLVMALHTYKIFDGHVHLYVRSMVESVYKLAKEYEKMGYVTIDPWVRIELSTIPILDFNPNINVEFRNQAAAQTDCLLKYKESVEFIVFVDLDDLIFPRVAGTYSDEYRDLFGLNKIDIFTEADNIRSDYDKKGVGSIQYAKFNVHVEGHRFPNNFSISQMFSSMYFTHKKETGKIVARPRLINHTWIHCPISMKPGFFTREVPSKTNVITHFKILEEERHPPNKTVVVPFFDPLFRFGETFLISPTRIKALQEDLDRVIKLPNVQKIWKTLPTATFYLQLITECFNKTFYDFYYGGQPERIKCPGPERCKIPKNPGIPCSNARADYYSSTGGTLLNIHYSRNHQFVTEDGCIV